MPGKGRPFQKGNKYGNGRPALTKEERALKKMTREDALKLISKHCHKNYEELKHEIKNKNKIPCLELLVMRIMESAIAKADLKKLDWLFYQLWGKPKELNEEQKDRVIHLKYSLDNGGHNGESERRETD